MALPIIAEYGWSDWSSAVQYVGRPINTPSIDPAAVIIVTAMRPDNQGLTLVPFPAQLEPILTQKHTLNTP